MVNTSWVSEKKVVIGKSYAPEELLSLTRDCFESGTHREE